MANLTASALVAAMFLQKDMFADAAKKADYVAEVNAANALVENTTAKIGQIVERSDKKQSVKIYWNKRCTPAATGTEPNFCTISGTEPDSDSKTYTLAGHVHSKFTIDEALYEDNMLNISEVFADEMLKAKKANDEAMTQGLISRLELMVGSKQYQETPGCPSVVSPADWTTTYIPPANWTPELMHYLLNVKRLNKFTAPFLLDSKNFSFKMWESMMNASNASGAGANNMMKTFKYYEDLVNMAEVAPGKTFMVDRGTTAFVNRSRWKGTSAQAPILEPDIARKKYAEPSENIKGVTYDVYITTECSGPYKKHNILVHGMYDLFNGPSDCAGDITGVLELQCGACPS